MCCVLCARPLSAVAHIAEVQRMYGVICRCGQACAQCSGFKQGCAASLRQRGGRCGVPSPRALAVERRSACAMVSLLPRRMRKTKTPTNVLAGAFLTIAERSATAHRNFLLLLLGLLLLRLISQQLRAGLLKCRGRLVQVHCRTEARRGAHEERFAGEGGSRCRCSIAIDPSAVDVTTHRR